jgi:hypothetical protein
MNDVTVASSAAATLTGVRGENPFDVLFRPAKPILDAIVQMRAPITMLGGRRGRGSTDLAEIMQVIPPESDLVEARRLFREAEHEPAPEGWTGIAVAMMADAMPPERRVNDLYVCAIVDGAYNDPEVWGSYAPGFSHAVIARSVREALRLDGLPPPGAFLKICSRHRSLFKQWHADLGILNSIRFDAVHGPCPF